MASGARDHDGKKKKTKKNDDGDGDREEETTAVFSFSWQEKKDIADREQETLQNEIQQLQAWTDMIDSMNDEQVKEYLKNRPDELKTIKIQKSSKPPRQKAVAQVQRVRKPKSSTNNNSMGLGIMASVWKFHKPDDDQE